MGKDERHGPGLRGLPALLLLASLSFPRSLPAGEEIRPWKGFQVILWAFRDPAPPGLARTLRELGITALNCEFGRPSPWVEASGLPVYVGHAAGKGFLYMSERNWRPLFDAWYRSRDPSLLVRRPCLSDPKAYGGALERLEKTLAGLSPERTLALSLDDEISATHFIDPIDFCRGPFCLAAFRAWMRRRIPSLEALSERWGRKLSSWKDVLPPTTDGMRKGTGNVLYPANLAWWNDHLAFRDHLLAHRVAGLLDRVRRLRPALPSGFLGGQAPAAWGGYDWSLLARRATFLEAYDIGGARDVAASFAPSGARRVETLFPGKDLQAARARFHDMLAHGLSGAILWSSRIFLDRRGRPKAAAKALAPAFREAAGPVGAALAGSRPAPGPWIAAVLESQPSLRLHWWKDARRDGPTWPRRFGSFEAKHSTSMAARVSWIRLLEDQGFQARFLSPADLEGGALLKGESPPRLLVLPRIVALGEGACRAVRAFVAAGGTVLADGETALYTDALIRRKEGALDGLFGIHRPRDPSSWNPSDRNGRALPSAFRPEGLPLLQVGIEPVQGTESRVSAGRNWDFSARRGAGRAFYWNLSLCPYASLRGRPGPPRGVLLARRLLARAAGAAGMAPPFGARLRDEAFRWVPLERMARISPAGRRLWVLRVNLGEEGLRRIPPGTRLSVRITAPAPVRLRDVARGKDLGRGRSWDLALDPFAFLLFQVTP